MSHNHVLEDGHGNTWNKCFLGEHCQMQVVRPGRTQCECETNDNIDLVDVERLKLVCALLTKEVQQLKQSRQ